MKIKHVSSLLGEETPGSAELMEALRNVPVPQRPIRSRRALQKHLIAIAQEYGISMIDTPVSGYEELIVRTRIKHALRYGNTPTTKKLIISWNFVRRVYPVYRRWSQLGELLVSTSLWHEYKHLHQDFSLMEDPRKREEEANRFMMEKTGLPGIVASLWYYSLYRQKTMWDRFITAWKDPSRQRETARIIECLHRVYGNLIPPSFHDRITRDVLWLDVQFRKHR